MTLHGTTTASWLQYERTVNACLYTTVSRKIIDLARRASGPVHLARDLRPIGETDRSLKEWMVDWKGAVLVSTRISDSYHPVLLWYLRNTMCSDVLESSLGIAVGPLDRNQCIASIAIQPFPLAVG